MVGPHHWKMVELHADHLVLNEPLQPLTNESHSTHPTGFFRDGYCWGSDQDPGKHYIGAVVTDQFLQFSKERGALRIKLPSFGETLEVSRVQLMNEGMT